MDATPAATEFAAAPAAPTPRLHLNRNPRHLALAGLASGLVAAWAFAEKVGFGFWLFSVSIIIALLALGGREAMQVARGQRWLVASALVLTSFVVLRDNGTLVFFDIVGAGLLLLLAANAWSGARPVADLRLSDLVTVPFSSTFGSAAAGATVVADSARGSGLSARILPLASSLFRIGFIAGPIVGFVTLLLAWGDAAFGMRLAALTEALVKLPVEQVIGRSATVLFIAPAVAGFIAWALRRREGDRAPASAAFMALRAPEAFALVGGLAFVSFLFSAVGAECALSPDACELPKGMNYATYAHEGFFQLVIAASVILGVLLFVPGRTLLETCTKRRVFNAVATLLVITTLPLLASAARRMMLYEHVYGFTTLRVWSQATTVLLALLVSWRAITLWTRPERFAVGLVASCVVCLVGLNVINPDALIARGNLSLVAEGRPLDTEYLNTLSTDAAPVITEYVRAHGTPGLCPSGLQRSNDGLAAFNVSRWKALHELNGVELSSACFEEPERVASRDYDEWD